MPSPDDVRRLLGLLADLKPQRGPDGLPKRHQPLALLWAAGRARTGKDRMAPWPEASRDIGRLIDEFGRETDARNPHLPFLALAGHPELWELSATPPPKGRAGDPRLAWLNRTRPWVRGGLTRAAYDLLATSDEAAWTFVDHLTASFFDDSDVDPSALLRAVELEQHDLEQHDLERRPDGGGRRGAGYVADATLRLAIERHAVDQAIRFYREQGYEVTDVGAVESYDLRAVGGGDRVHVEVKGATGTAEDVELTEGEVRHASKARTDLFVVDRIEWERRPDGGIRTSGGRSRHWSAWRPAEVDLRPTRYRYRLPLP